MRLSVEINTGPDTIYFVLPGTPGPDGPDGPKPLFRWKIPFFPTNHQALDKTPGRWKGSKDRIPGPDRPAPAGPAPARTCPPLPDRPGMSHKTWKSRISPKSQINLSKKCSRTESMSASSRRFPLTINHPWQRTIPRIVDLNKHKWAAPALH